MPPTQTLAEIKKLLSDLLIEDLALAMRTAKELLPENSEKHQTVIALQARLQVLNKDRARGVIDTVEYAKRIAGISADFQDMVEALNQNDLEQPGPAGKKSGNLGSVLYKVPPKMPLLKSALCVVRVAADTDDILADIVFDENTRLRERVEISERMSAELIDAEGNIFDIQPLNAAHQQVRKAGYTQWLFRVTPKIVGEHQLMVKVSMLEWDQNIKEYLPRDISILETVTIVTEALEEEQEPPYKATQHQIVLSAAGSSAGGRSIPRGLRTLALFLAFLLVGTTASWAFTPPPVRELFVATIQADLSNNTQALKKYVSRYHDKPEAAKYVDEAYFRILDRSDDLADMRTYQQEEGISGKFTAAVELKIRTLEAREVASIKLQPDTTAVRTYLQRYPDATLLPEIKQAVESKQITSTVLLPEIETAYVRSINTAATAPKIEAFVRDFPKSRYLPEVANIAVSKPEIVAQTRPVLTDALIRHVQNASKKEEVLNVLPALEQLSNKSPNLQLQQVIRQKPREFQKALDSALKQEPVYECLEKPKTATPPSEEKTDSGQPIAAKNIEKKPIDSDGDGIADLDDNCPNTPGEAQYNGCPPPDSDGDGMPDKHDLCPNQKGPIKFNGCPDSDGDGISDFYDKCPNIKGDSVYQGCPPPVIDTDEDGVPDKYDQCPNEKGLQELNGCPDRDGDGIADKFDQCPDAKGDSTSHGCPVSVSDFPVRPDNMVLIQGGTFMIGSEDGFLDERPVHQVTLSDFYLSKYEVTNAEFVRFLNAKGNQEEGGVTWIDLNGKSSETVKQRILQNDKGYYVEAGYENYPVIYVTWYGAQAYCKWLSDISRQIWRLPTEAEWEFAARGGLKSRHYSYAGSDKLDEVGWYDGNSKEQIHPVGALKANELGLYDMSGNVVEWCSDWYGNYQAAAQTNPPGPVSGSGRVRRGGSWSTEPARCRVAYRYGWNPYFRDIDLGFRLAKTK